MEFNKIQHIWDSKAGAANQPALSASQIGNLLHKIIEADKLLEKKKMRRLISVISCMFFLYIGFFFFFYGRSIELTVSISTLAILFWGYFFLMQKVDEPSAFDVTVASMLQESKRKINRINTIIKYALILFIPGILLLTTFINGVMGNQIVSDSAVFLIFLFCFLLLLLLSRKITDFLVRTAYSKHMAALNRQVDKEVE